MKKLLVLSALVLTLGAACGDDDPEVAAADDVAPGATTATVEVALEPVTGVFTEGFELTVRFEATDGSEIETVDWTEFVQAEGDGSIESFYESVLAREVPAGVVNVVTTMEIGMSGGPFDPCTTELDLAGGDTARVVLAFDGTCSAE